jgi:hypothetical protein
MVILSSIDAFDHDIFPCIVSFKSKMPTWWGFYGTDGVQSYLIPMFIFKT